MTTTTEELKRKHKIHIEYPIGYGLTKFAILDLNKVQVKVFTKDGKEVCHNDIKTLSMCIKKECDSH